MCHICLCARCVQAFTRFPNSLDEIEERIHELQAQADMCAGTSDQVVDEYEERARKIDGLREKLESTENSIQKHTDEITALKERSGRKGEGGREGKREDLLQASKYIAMEEKVIAK